MVITDNEFPMTRMFGTNLMTLDQIMKHRAEFLQNPNVFKFGFHHLSTVIEKDGDMYKIKSKVQDEPFESERMTLDIAVMIFDMLIGRNRVQ